jgi:energy-coupling factor transporter ATP-binding protein EcfA2
LEDQGSTQRHLSPVWGATPTFSYLVPTSAPLDSGGVIFDLPDRYLAVQCLGASMRLTFNHDSNSITESVTDEEIADYIVLSGPNGSGKSNLLEAIHTGATRIEGVAYPTPGQPSPHIRLFRLAELVAVGESPQALGTFRDRWVQLDNATKQIIQSQTRMRAMPGSRLIPPGSDEMEEVVRSQLIAQRQVSSDGLNRMLLESGKRLIDFTTADFRRYSPMFIGIRDPFTITVSEVFITYHLRRVKNKFVQWLATEEPESVGPTMSDEEFEERYGPSPWDLLNETMAIVGLEYRFVAPTGTEEDLMYEAKLIHEEIGIEVAPAKLSSGEKTLMAVAMSMYTGSRLGEAIELPQVLLLDEADASLHPSMVQSLLRVTDDIFCKRYGVKVLLTTHSPSTVALAPEESLYSIRRGPRPRLRRATRDEVLRSLTVGVPTLSVRIENRRQVFVESEWDEACYHELYRLLRARLDSPLSLSFVASGKGGQGSAEGVKRLVTSLRAAGNMSVLGVVDRDNRGGAPDAVHYIAGRYSLENVVLDPLAVGIFLLRERISDAASMGLAADAKHFEVDCAGAQKIAEFVTQSVQTADDDSVPANVSYLGECTVVVPRFYLEMNGHALEERLIAKWAALRRFGPGLKVRVIERALGDAPHYIPSDVVNLFKELLAS